MSSHSLRFAKNLPLILLALLGLYTSLQVGCSMAGSDDAGVTEDGLDRGYGGPYGYGSKGR